MVGGTVIILYVVNGRESCHLAAKHSVSVLDSNAERQFSLPTGIATLSIRLPGIYKYSVLLLTFGNLDKDKTRRNSGTNALILGLSRLNRDG